MRQANEAHDLNETATDFDKTFHVQLYQENVDWPPFTGILMASHRELFNKWFATLTNWVNIRLKRLTLQVVSIT